MFDRAQQALYLLALDPVVETTADKNSYGFRQQRSCADAIEQGFNALKSATTQWVLEGDIKSCFDKISHDWLLAHVPRQLCVGWAGTSPEGKVPSSHSFEVCGKSTPLGEFHPLCGRLRHHR
jgi:RNA-directed DNA polymerase